MEDTIIAWKEWPLYEGYYSPDINMLCPECNNRLYTVDIWSEVSYDNGQYFTAICVHCKQRFDLFSEEFHVTLDTDPLRILLLEARVKKQEQDIATLQEQVKTLMHELHRIQKTRTDQNEYPKATQTQTGELTRKYAYLLK